MTMTMDLASAVTQTNSTQIERDAVTRGVALLDQRMPGWHRMINLPMLDIQDTNLCVLGQLFGSWCKGVNEWCLYKPTKMVSYWGFDASDDIAWGGLNYLWHAEIYNRQMLDSD